MSNPSGISAEQFRLAGEQLASWKAPLLVSHVRADGDSLGSLIAAASILAGRGAAPKAMVWEPIPVRYRFLQGIDLLTVCPSPGEAELAGVDGVLILDTCSKEQLSPIAEWLSAADVPRIVLDHHLTCDDIADVVLIDSSAAAASQLLNQWATVCGWALPAAAAEALFVGIATDTGWFRFESTSAAVLRAAADLIETGLAPDRYHRQLYLSEPISTFRLRAAALGGIELHHGDRVAIVTVTQSMLADAGASQSDTENLANEALAILGVLLSISLVETADGPVKCSFRSQRGGIDVSQLAQQFGGGGHARAAGARIPGTIESVKKTILSHLQPGMPGEV